MYGAFDRSSILGEHSVLWLAALLAAVASLPRFDEQPNLVAVWVQVSFPSRVMPACKAAAWHWHMTAQTSGNSMPQLFAYCETSRAEKELPRFPLHDAYNFRDMS